MISTNRLDHLMESVMFVRDGAGGRFAATFEALERLANDKGIAIALVGGIAAIHYGYATTTEDVDILLANAGATWGTDSFEEVDEKNAWDKVMDLNLKGVFFTIQK